MRVLLINPITPERRMIHNTPNLGLGYLATALRKSGIDVDICDGMKRGMSRLKLEQRLSKFDYDAVGIQVYTCSVNESLEIVSMLRKGSPGLCIILGGPHASGAPDSILNVFAEADFAVRGEGEQCLPKLLNKIFQVEDCDFGNIPNLIYRVEGDIHYNDLQPIQDIDSVGLPSWDLINPREYPDAPIGAFAKNFPLTTISCTRGCAHSCTFCANTRIMGKRLRPRSPDIILEEMDLLYNKYGIREFQIIDDCFTSSREIAMAVCEGIIERGMDISISFPNGVRIESLDEELLRMLERAGCYSLGMAIESGSQRIIDHMRRGQTLEMIRSKIDMAKRVCKIRLSGFFIIGYPEENEEDINSTIKLARELPLSRANFTLWMPVPGSTMTESLQKEGKLEDVESGRVMINKISYVSENISRERLKKLIVKAYSSFYLRPGIILGLLSELRSREQMVFIFRRVVGLFMVKT